MIIRFFREWIILYKTTGLERLLCPFFPLFLLITLGLLIERIVTYTKVGNKIKKGLYDPEPTAEKYGVNYKVKKLEYLLQRNTLWFIVIALISLSRIFIRFFYGIYSAMDFIGKARELMFYALTPGIAMMSADFVFISTTFFIACLCFVFLYYWKQKLIYYYYMSLYEKKDK